MTTINQNLVALNQELDWLVSVIDQAIKSYLLHDGHENNWQDLPLPAVIPNTAYGNFIKQHQLDSYARLALALTIAPQLRPHALDIFFSKNSIYDRSFTEFGGITANHYAGFLPTVQTLNFLFTVKDPLLFEKVNVLLTTSHVLQKERVVIIGETVNSLPKLSASISIHQNWFDHFVTGENLAITIDNQFGGFITSNLAWDDLVLAPQTLAQISEITSWSKYQNTLMQEWGLNQKLKPGYRVLFYGEPGTGKTLTTTLIGKALGKFVFRIDFVALVSSFIDKTEKNLAQIFKTANDRDWILYVDDADALFDNSNDNRSTIDHHNKVVRVKFLEYASDFAGLIIFSTTFSTKSNKCFASLFQNVIYFPMPDVAQRLRLWQNAFSGKISLAPDVNLTVIAENYPLSAGAIANVLRYCAIDTLQKNEILITENDLVKGVERENSFF